MDETPLETLKRRVGWSEEDEGTLRALHGEAARHVPRIAKTLLAAILPDESAKQPPSGGEDQVDDLESRLQHWLEEGLRGPWDEGYYQARCRMSRGLVRVGLPQDRLFGAMSVARCELTAIAAESHASDPERLVAACVAVGRIVDLELAIALRVYREDLERLATVGQLVGCIGHDLRNPLGVIETSLFLLRGRAGEDERMKKHLDRIGEQIAVANGIITDLLDIIRNKPLVKERVRLDEVIESVAESMPRPESVVFATSGLEGLGVDGSAVQLRRVFVNLLTNAVQAASPSGEVGVRGSRAKDQVVIAVEDTGRGVDEATARRLFVPLTTSKEEGVGLGLALVKRIVERHGGTVAYERRAGGGARFVVRLPA